MVLRGRHSRPKIKPPKPLAAIGAESFATEFCSTLGGPAGGGGTTDALPLMPIPPNCICFFSGGECSTHS